MPVYDPPVSDDSAPWITYIHVIVIPGSFAFNSSTDLASKKDTNYYHFLSYFRHSKQTKRIRYALLLLTTAVHAVASSPFSCVSYSPASFSYFKSSKTRRFVVAAFPDNREK